MNEWKYDIKNGVWYRIEMATDPFDILNLPIFHIADRPDFMATVLSESAHFCSYNEAVKMFKAFKLKVENEAKAN